MAALSIRVRFTYLMFSYRGSRTQALSNACKIDQADLIDLMPSYHLTSYWKSALTQKLFARIPKSFHYHEKTKETKI